MKAKCVFLISLLLSCSAFSSEEKWFNPITDICWNCIYPLHIAGGNLTPSSKDTIKHDDVLCHCPGGIVGVPVAYWPSKLIEVTTTPFKLVAFGGMELSKPGIKKRGNRKAYHVHYYLYPAFALMGLAEHFVCSSEANFDIGYLSEFDPFWFDDSWNNILYPEAFLFGSPLAHAACLPDCLLTTLNRPTNKLFWCSGCQGSLYPFNGHVKHVRGPVQTSSLLVHRVLAKLHRWRVAKTFEEGNYCEKTYSNFPRKTSYKIQLAQPIKQTVKKCPSLGANEYDWGFSKTYPGKGESFTYVIWERSHCCVDPYEITKKVLAGGAG